MKSILLVEDDQSLGYILKEYLQMHDFDVTWAKDGEQGLETFAAGNFDLCILDVMMPKMDGFSLADRLKQQDPLLPLIFLTAKSLKIDKLKGFKAGADDYLVKPVDEEELIMRIQAVLRRTSAKPAAREAERHLIGSYEFVVKNQQLVRNGIVRSLTKKESQLLLQLCNNKGELTSSDALLKSIWGENSYFTRRSMDVFISKLRKYLSEDDKVSITNMHGAGYILDDR